LKNLAVKYFNLYKIRFRILCILVTAGIFLIPTGLIQAYQQPDLETLLRKMRQARRRVAFTAEVNVERQYRNKLRVYKKRVIARPPEEFSEEIVLTPEERKQLEKMREQYGRKKERDPRRGDRRIPREFRNNNQSAVPNIRIDMLQKNYDVSIVPGEEIAGRKATKLSIVPHYPLRPTNYFWIDAETGIVLKRELYNAGDENAPVYREIFLSIEYEEADTVEINRAHKEWRENRARRSSKREGVSTSEYRVIGKLPEALRTALVMPTVIPEGFVMNRLRVINEKDRISYHQVYTDGLIIFSLFQNPKDSHGRSGPSPRWENPNMTILIKRSDNAEFVLVGYANRRLLKSVLDSLPGKEVKFKRR